MMTNTSTGVEPITQIGDVSTQIGDPYNPHAMSHYEAPKDDTEVTIEKLLSYEEGYRGQPYHCSEGYVTYGIGHKLSIIKDEPLDKYLRMWISYDDAVRLLQQDLQHVHNAIDAYEFAGTYNGLSNDRQVIIKSMVYQMGASAVAKFKNMWKDIEDGDFRGAAFEMIDSKWREQTPKRADRHAEVMHYGDLKQVYEKLIP